MEHRTLRAVAEGSSMVSLSSEATVQTPTRLEITTLEFALPPSRVVREVRLNGQAQPKVGMPVKHGDYLQ